MMREELRPLTDENEECYIWRVGQLKDSGTIELSWSEVADAVNESFRSDESEYRTESAYRKIYQQAKRLLEAGVFQQYDDNGYIDKLCETKQELAKEKQKVADERRELTRKLREQSRKEAFIDTIRGLFKEIQPMELKVSDKEIAPSDNDLLVHLTDIHCGIEVDNAFNKFDDKILKKRLEKYTEKIIDIKRQHNSEKCYIVIGEILSGLIHPTLRIESNENVIEQFIVVSGLIASMLSQLSLVFKIVHVYVTPGNHSRVVAEKEFSLHGENFDHLLGYYLRARLQNYDNIIMNDNLDDVDIARFKVRGKKVYGAHGDKDTPANVVQNFTMMFGEKPDIVLLGHRHTNGLTTVFDTKVIQSGCVSGADNYCIDHRLRNLPEQTVSVIDSSGLRCIYDVRL